MSRNTTRGKIAAAKKGKKLSGHNYGYDRLVFDEKGRRMCRIHFSEVFRKPKSWISKLVPSADVKAVNTVRWIFRDSLKRYNPQQIADELNRHQVPSPRGTKHWRRAVVTRMLRNPVYIGTCINGVRKTGKFFDMGGPIVVENAHKALIDRKLFRAVQPAVRLRRPPSPVVSGYILNGLLFCGHCGAPMVAHTCRRNENPDRSYICSRHFTRTTVSCFHPSVAAEKLEAFVIQTAIEAIAKESVEKVASALSQLEFGIDRLEFAAGIVDFHLPVDTALGFVDVSGPRRNTIAQGL